MLRNLFTESKQEELPRSNGKDKRLLIMSSRKADRGVVLWGDLFAQTREFDATTVLDTTRRLGGMSEIASMKFRWRVWRISVLAALFSVQIFVGSSFAQGVCQGSFYKPLKYKIWAGSGLVPSMRSITTGFDTWKELETDTRNTTISYFRAIPSITFFDLIPTGVPDGPMTFVWQMVDTNFGDQVMTGDAAANWAFGYSNTACPPGYIDYGGSQCYLENSDTTVCPDPEKDLGPPNDSPQSCSGDLAEGDTSSISEGNPINSATGNKYEVQTDFKGAGERSLVFQRFYNSNPSDPTHLGLNWRSTYDRSLALVWLPTYSAAQVAALSRPDGKRLYFQPLGAEWVANSPDTNGTLVQMRDLNGLTNGWMYTSERNEIEVYSPTGRLLSVLDRTGYTQVMAYDSGERLTQVSDSWGRSLGFSHTAANDPNGGDLQVASMTDPRGAQYSYSTSIANYLVTSSQITYPDGKFRTYIYNESGAYPLDSSSAGQLALNGFVLAMTGLIDENGQRYASWFYDNKGRAVSSEHAGGVNKVTLSYNADGSTQVTDARGISHLNTFTTAAGNVLLTGKTQPAGSGCMAAARNLVYDGAGNPTVRDNFNGERTCSVYDSRNLEVLRIEGLSGSVDCATVTATGATLPSGARKVSTNWHPDWRLPVQVSEPLLVTTSVYHGQPDPFNGNAVASCTPAAPLPNGKPVALLCKQVKQAILSDGSTDPSAPASVTRYTYDSLGNKLTETDPLGRVTTYSYYAAANFTGADPNAIGYSLGDLQSVTNPAGQVTQYPLYDKSGRVRRMIDPKDVVTDVSYTPRGWVSSVTVTPPGGAARTTSYSYDGVGQLTGVSQPDGSTLSYSYDAAHRLVGVTDAKGNLVNYVLDLVGNRIGEELKDPGGVLQRSIGRSFDALNRMQQVNGAVR